MTFPMLSHDMLGVARHSFRWQGIVHRSPLLQGPCVGGATAAGADGAVVEFGLRPSAAGIVHLGVEPPPATAAIRSDSRHTRRQCGSTSAVELSLQAR